MEETYKERYYRKMTEAKSYLGGTCVRCGNCDSLDIHHTDPTQKSFNVSSRIVNMSWDNVVFELDKCELLCEECHKEETRIQQGWSKIGTHGTLNTYTKQKCRCDECRRVWNEASRRYKQKYRSK